MPEKIFELLSGFNEVEAVALGGSRSGGSFDESSDYDVYAYLTSPLDEEKRRAALSEYCGILPADFEKNINGLFSVMTSFGNEPQRVFRQAAVITEELEKTVNSAK